MRDSHELCLLMELTVSRPELIGDKTLDYSIYTLDATEGLESELYEGQGLLSWGLSQPARLAKIVSGFVKPTLSGTVLEVRMKLSQVVQSSQQDFITSMQSFERISRTLPATFDYSNWTEFMKHTALHSSQPTVGNGLAHSQKSVNRIASATQINTLQKARELAGRQNTPQSMSAQLKSAKQHQSSQQRHARMIAQQAAATQASTHQNLSQAQHATQRRAESMEGDGPLPAEPASPQLPTPSSPPQMKTFPPPPVVLPRSNSLPMQTPIEPSLAPSLVKYSTAIGTDLPQNSDSRGLKRKASELSSSISGSARSKDFSPSKTVNAAKNNIGVIQHLFKAKSPGMTVTSPAATVLDKLQKIKDGSNTGAQLPPSSSVLRQGEPARAVTTGLPGPNLNGLQRNEAELLRALEDGQPIKFCYNCGNIQTRGNWRQLEVHGKKHNLCNACGVYWKTKHRMRPEKLWDRNRPTGQDTFRTDFPSTIPSRSGGQRPDPTSTQHTPLSSEQDNDDSACLAQTSPLKDSGYHMMQTLNTRTTQSSPVPASTSVQKTKSMAAHGQMMSRPRTPTRETLHELNVNTPPPLPSPSPASGNGLEDLVALLQTPKKSFTSKALSSPSPWRSMFTLLDEVQKDGPESPSRQKLDKFLEDLGMTNGTGGTPSFNFDSIAAFPLSPVAQQNLDSLASFMSSPPGMGLFTSSGGMENDNSTPEDLEPPLSARKGRSVIRTPQKPSTTGEQHHGHFEEGDSLFTPKKYNTRSRPESVQRGLRSAGSIFGDQMFGASLQG